MSFTCYPAIDVRDGRVVRLQQGDYARETRYDDDPFARAGAFADAGARWLHLVDLDAARTGGYTLQPLLRRLAEDGRLRVQTGGGVRMREDVAALRAAGAARVVVGSLAVEQPMAVAEWLTEFGPESIVVALDVRLDDAGRWCPATRGWTQESGVDLTALLDIFRTHGLRHLLCTDIARDGMLSGPNLDLYASLQTRIPGIALQASGGMRDANDVQAARAAGCAGAVLGRALLEGRLDLREALAC